MEIMLMAGLMLSVILVFGLALLAELEREELVARASPAGQALAASMAGATRALPRPTAGTTQPAGGPQPRAPRPVVPGLRSDLLDGLHSAVRYEGIGL